MQPLARLETDSMFPLHACSQVLVLYCGCSWAHACAQALLRLSSRGEALIAELQRLSAHVPHLFSLAEKAEQKQFGEVLLDFRYLRAPELCEHRIESSAELIARDAEVWDAHGGIICRLFALFEAIYTYIKDFAKCLADLREGAYIQQTVEGVLEHEEGKQLMCEQAEACGVDASPLCPGHSGLDLIICTAAGAAPASPAGERQVVIDVDWPQTRVVQQGNQVPQQTRASAAASSASFAPKVRREMCCFAAPYYTALAELW